MTPSLKDVVNEEMPDSIKLLSMGSVNKDLVKRVGELLAHDHSSWTTLQRSIMAYIPLLEKLHKHVMIKLEGGVIEESVIDKLVTDARTIDDNIVDVINKVKDKNGNLYTANTSEPITKDATNEQLTNYSPDEDRSFVPTVPCRVSKGNKLDRDFNICEMQISAVLPRSLSRGFGADPSLVNAECAAKQVHFDACCTVIDKKQYDDKLEPAGFIEQSGAQDETEYYLPIGLKRLVQSAISFLVTGRQMIVTSWTKEGGDNVLDKNGGSLSIGLGQNWSSTVSS